MNKEYKKRLINHAFLPVPTVRAAIYLPLLLGVCTYAIKRDNIPMSILGTALILIPVVSLVYAFICFAGVSVELMFSSPYLKKGEQGYVILTALNVLPLPLPALKANLFIPAADEDGFIRTTLLKKTKAGVTMGGASSASATKQVAFAYAGNFCARCKRISLYDPLGLVRFVSLAELSLNLGVVPVTGIYTEAVTAKNGDGVGSDRNKKGDDRDEIFDISDYVPGDSLKDVHWKRSAKAENLQIIRFAEKKNRCQCVLADMGNYFAEQEEVKNPLLRDRVLEVALGTCRTLMSEGDSVRLAWVNGGEDLGITATVEDAFVSMCKSVPAECGGNRINPEFLFGAESVILVTGTVNEFTIKQVSAIQSECGFVKGTAVLSCSESTNHSAEKLEGMGITVKLAVGQA